MRRSTEKAVKALACRKQYQLHRSTEDALLGTYKPNIDNSVRRHERMNGLHIDIGWWRKEHVSVK